MEHQGLRILFDSKDKKFKSPFGALKTGQECYFNILVPKSCPAKNVFFVLEKDGEKEIYYKMQRGQTDEIYVSFSLKMLVDKKGLYFYWFYIEKESDGFRLFKEGYYDTNMEAGEKWQLTCYDKKYVAPTWSEGAVIYQIFPDRFYKSGECNLKGKITPFSIHKDMSDLPRWYPDGLGNWNNDFFGGNLRGITEKLDYIKDLGADIIYLNPIVKAFSNHRYDTADYKSVDPMLGTTEDFKKLCNEAHNHNIKIVIDGVFSHTGNRSIYYEDALKSENSPYRDWYDFKSFWWGIETLPQIKKGHKGFIKYISEDVIPFWMNLGADGIRLDVADELTDEFIRQITKSSKEIKDAIIIGEVWEDASNKISYGERRSYLFGDELDSVMNYPFLNSIVGFIKGYKNADEFAYEILTIAENYPTEILNSCMNILSTHDTVRIITLLGTDNFSISKEDKSNFKLCNRAKAEELVKIAAFLQFILPGVPSIYYGDEIGMEGFEDPFNRKFFEWENVDCELREFYKNLCTVKHKIDSLKTGNIRFECQKGLLIFFRNEIKAIVNMTEEPYEFTGEIIISQNTKNSKVYKNGFALIKE